jgi:hypothetical protein
MTPSGIAIVVLAASVLCYSAWVQVPAEQHQHQQQQQQQQQQTVLQASPQKDHSTSSWLQQEQCQALFKARREMTAEEASAVAERTGRSNKQFCPALLWTYTGTGNTMTRMLIEVASGWYTGSVYTGEFAMQTAEAARLTAKCMGMSLAD